MLAVLAISLVNALLVVEQITGNLLFLGEYNK